MKILFISPYVPSPLRVRPYHFIRGLARAGHSVDVISQVTSKREWEDANALSEFDNVSVTSVALPAWRPFLNGSLAVLKGESLWVAHGKNPRFLDSITQALKDTSYDVMHVEHIRSLFISPLFSEIRNQTHRPRMIFDAVDCISALLSQYAKRPGNPLRRLIYRREASKMRSVEPASAVLFDRVIITSEMEKQALSTLMGDKSENIQVIPNGVDLAYFRPSPTLPAEDTLLFSGRMSFFNNVEAAKFFVNGVFPLIKAKRPKAKLILAGADPPSDLQDLDKRPDIEVTGYAEDLRPYLRKCAVVVCPMLTAVGVQNKVLEAMAMGKPVVGTPLVAQALAAQNEKDIIIAEPAKEVFAEAVLSLLEHPDRCRTIGLNARDYVERSHNWAVSTQLLTDTYAAGEAST